MTELVAAGTVNLQAYQPLNGMLESFISYVDRSEKTERTYIVNLRQWAAYLKYKGIDTPQREDVVNYRTWLQNPHEAVQLDGNSWKYRTDSNGKRITLTCKPATASLYIRSVKAFYNWTEEAGLYPNISKSVRAPKASSEEKARLEPEDVVRVETSIEGHSALKVEAAAENRKDTSGRIERATLQGKRLNAMYQLAVNCGLRTIEISRADVKDLEVKNGQAWLWVQGKGHTSADEKQALTPEVYEALQEYLEARTDNYNGNSPLFVATGNRSGGQRISTTTISTLLKQALKEAGYNSAKLTAHSLRHSSTSAAYNATENLYAAQKYARHSDPATTERYIHADNEDRQKVEMAQKVYQYNHGVQLDCTDRLAAALQKLSPEKLEQLTLIAEAMA